MSGQADWEALLKRLRAGDDAARQEVVCRCAKRLEQQVSKMLGRFPGVHRWEQTDDVLQGAMMRFHQLLNHIQLDSVRCFLGLAGEHIRRELIDLHRKYFGPEGLGTDHMRPWLD